MFDEIYEIINKKYRVELEKKRILLKEARSKSRRIVFKMLLLLMVLIFGASFICFIIKIPFEIAIIIDLLMVAVWWYIINRNNEDDESNNSCLADYMDEYEKVENEIVKYIDNNIKFKDGIGVTEDIFARSGFFYSKPHYGFSSYSFMKFRTNNKEIEISDINIKYYNHGSDGIPDEIIRSWNFSAIESYKEFDGTIHILGDKNIVNGYVYLKNMLKRKITTESEEFNKYMDLYTNIEGNINDILDKEILDKLAEFYKKANDKFEIILKDKMIYVRFINKNSSLFTKESEDVLDRSMVREFYNKIYVESNLLKYLADTI